MKYLLTGLLALILVIGGCAGQISDTDKQLNKSNLDAAKYISVCMDVVNSLLGLYMPATSTYADIANLKVQGIKQASNDIQKNSEQLGSVIGNPKDDNSAYNALLVAMVTNLNATKEALAKEKEALDKAKKDNDDLNKKSHEEHLPWGKYGILATLIIGLTQFVKNVLPKILPLLTHILPSILVPYLGPVISAISSFLPALNSVLPIGLGFLSDMAGTTGGTGIIGGSGIDAGILATVAFTILKSTGFAKGFGKVINKILGGVNLSKIAPLILSETTIKSK